MNLDNTEKDLALLEGCLSGQERAMELLYKKYFGYVMAICLRYCRGREEAMEICNDAFLNIFQNLHRYESTWSFKSWIRRITINKAIDHYRKNKKFQFHLDVEEARPYHSSDDVVGDLSVDDMMEMLQDLPELHRVIFNMYEIEGYSHDEIAEKLEMPASTSRVYLGRAKSKLRDLYNNKFLDHYERTL